MLLGAAMPCARGFRRKAEQLRARQNLVELTEVIEHHGRLRPGGKAGVCAQVAQDAVADAALWNLTKLLLDGLQGFAGLPVISGLRQFQPHRENRREPTDGAGQIHILKETFAAVPFQIRIQHVAAAPATPRASQRRQEQIVNLRVVCRGNLMQQGLRFVGRERNF